MDYIKNQKGALLVFEVVILAAVLLVTGFAGYQYVKNTKAVNKATAPKPHVVASASPVSAASPNAGWTQFCGDVCFNYPTDWKATSTSGAGRGPGENIASPSGQVAVSYISNLGGLGGACPQCSFKTLSIAKPSGSNAGSLEVVKGLLNGYPTSSQVSVVYAILSSQKIAQLSLVAGQTSPNTLVFGLFTNPLNSSQQDQLSITDTQNSGSFSSEAAAESWLGQAEVTTAGQILSSVELKTQ